MPIESLNFTNKIWLKLWVKSYLRKLVGPSEKKSPLFDQWPKLRFFRLIFDLCPQRQVRHPFVHDLQDCWQTQRHLYISESARDQWPNPTQIHCPKPLTPPFLSSTLVALSRIYPQSPARHPERDQQKTKRFRWSLFILCLETQTSTLASQQPWSTTACTSCICFAPFSSPLEHLPFFLQISQWLRKCDPVCLLPHPLLKESVLARGPDVERCRSLTRACVTFKRRRPCLLK